MDKTTCFSSFRKKIDDSDCESLAPEDDEDEDDFEADELQAYTPPAVQNLTEEIGIEDDDYGLTSIITLRSRCASLKAVILSGHGYLCVYVGLVLLFLGATVALVLVCLQIVRPYISVINYKRSDCYTVSTIREGLRGCMCGIGCNNKYSCILVTVMYKHNIKNNTWVNATLYEDESLISAQCSFFPPCRSSQARIDITVSNYLKNFGKIGTHHPCYHSQERTGYVIRTKRFHVAHVIHGILWTLLAIMISVCGFIYTLRRKKCTVV